MQEYREVRTLTGQKIFVRVSKEELRERRIFWLEVTLAPLLAIWFFAKCAGMI